MERATGHACELEDTSAYSCGAEFHSKELMMFTLFVVLVFFVLAVPVGMETLGVLCGQVDQVSDSEWELYQQRYDEGCFPQAARPAVIDPWGLAKRAQPLHAPG